MAKRQIVIDIYKDPVSIRQLACWERWVNARVIFRKNKDHLNIKWLEDKLNGTYYTLSEQSYNDILEMFK